MMTRRRREEEEKEEEEEGEKGIGKRHKKMLVTSCCHCLFGKY